MLMEPLETEPSCSLLHSCTYQLLLWHLKANILQEPGIFVSQQRCFWQTADSPSELGDDSVFEYVAKAIWLIL